LLLEAALLLVKLLRAVLRPLLLVLVSAPIRPLPGRRDATIRLRKRLLSLWLGVSFLTLPLVLVGARAHLTTISGPDPVTGTVRAVLLVLPATASRVLFRRRCLLNFRRRTSFLAVFRASCFV
jgi:hypothetical protein